MNMKTIIVFSCLFLILTSLQLLQAADCTCSNLKDAQLAEERSASQKQWQKSFAAFKKQDTDQPYRKGGLVFVGSSSIRMWDLEKYFPEEKPLNRGFGGSQIVDACFAIDLLILKHKPKTVVLYAGDNDIARNKSPARVADDFARLAQKVHHHLPESRILYIAIKPSLKRWALAEKMKQTNRLVKKTCEQHAHLTFVDIWEPMRNEAGEPKPELFVQDGLHMSPSGYEIWTAAVKKHLAAEN